MTIIEDRLALLDTITLRSGAHDNFDAGACAMEAAAWIAGEPHSDHPKCVDPVIAAFMRTWNDGIVDDETRTRLLLPLVPLTIGTADGPELQDRRAFAAADWAVRVFTPVWLRLIPALVGHADTLAGLDKLDTIDAFKEARGPVNAARESADAAWDTAGDAARDAAGGAAGDAAWDAAGGAAGDAAWAAARAAAGGAAGAAAGDAAWDTARGAARAAAGAAAGDVLDGTVAELQASAARLVRELCEMSS
jgi:hypothetical protein